MVCFGKCWIIIRIPFASNEFLRKYLCLLRTEYTVRLFSTGNVLLLKNNLNLSPDTTEVSQEKLLSLVAERLLDSNSNNDVRTGFFGVNLCQVFLGVHQIIIYLLVVE